MRKTIAAINMTLDGYCDHTSINGDDELHKHYTELIANSSVLVYGRITYQLMEDFWPTVVKQPTGKKDIDEFAIAIDRIPKLVFSGTLNQLAWETARLATRGFKEEILKLKKEPGGDILICSPSLIVAALNLKLVDELQLNVQPTIVGKGLPLMKNIQERIDLKLLKTKVFRSGAVTFYYKQTHK